MEPPRPPDARCHCAGVAQRLHSTCRKTLNTALNKALNHHYTKQPTVRIDQTTRRGAQGLDGGDVAVDLDHIVRQHAPTTRDRGRPAAAVTVASADSSRRTTVTSSPTVAAHTAPTSSARRTTVTGRASGCSQPRAPAGTCPASRRSRRRRTPRRRRQRDPADCSASTRCTHVSFREPAHPPAEWVRAPERPVARGRVGVAQDGEDRATALLEPPEGVARGRRRLAPVGPPPTVLADDEGGPVEHRPGVLEEVGDRPPRAHGDSAVGSGGPRHDVERSRVSPRSPPASRPPGRRTRPARSGSC